MGVFIHPLTDWGFKRIFGDKELLMDFLNSLLEGERVITDLSYLNTERLAEESDGRKTVYDLYCKTDTGEYIIVEMQNKRQSFFKDLHGQVRCRPGQERKRMGFRTNGRLRCLFRELPSGQERGFGLFLQGHCDDRQAHGQGLQQQVPSDLHRASPLHEVRGRL